MEEQTDLQPGLGEVLIDVEAVGVNYADCLIRMGLYASARQAIGYPITPGFEVAGRVASAGADARGFPAGTPLIGVTRFNGYATQVVLRPEYLFPVPAKMTMPEAAGFSTVFLTAWYALLELAHPHPGAAILVHSAAGGVGGALVQLGKVLKGRVIAVVGASHKVAPVRDLARTRSSTSRDTNLWTRARQLAPEGYDVILDANGAATLRQSYAHLAPTGKLVVYGFHSMMARGRGQPNRLKLLTDYLRTPRFSPFQLTAGNHSVMGFNLSYLFDKTDLLRAGMNQLLAWAAEGRIRAPRVTTYPFERVAQAHRDLESGTTVGKLVLRVRG